MVSEPSIGIVLSYHSSDPELKAISMAKAAEWALGRQATKHLLKTDCLNLNQVS